MTTGMRSGEILALRKCDIEESYINVNYTWNPRFGLKCPKNGYTRKVPLYPEVKTALEELISKNPYIDFQDKERSFIFWGKEPGRPLSPNVLTERLYEALDSIGIKAEERKQRNIVFHSWRHFHATELASHCSEHSAQVVLGHLSPIMTRHYANHRTEKDLENVRKAMSPLIKAICKGYTYKEKTCQIKTQALP